jgi:hypothetical protein
MPKQEPSATGDPLLFDDLEAGAEKSVVCSKILRRRDGLKSTHAQLPAGKIRRQTQQLSVKTSTPIGWRDRKVDLRRIGISTIVANLTNGYVPALENPEPCVW